MTNEPPLTEERLRQIIREELTRYFDEGSDVLSAPASPMGDITQEQQNHFDAIQKLWSLHPPILPFSEDDTQS